MLIHIYYIDWLILQLELEWKTCRNSIPTQLKTQYPPSCNPNECRYIYFVQLTDYYTERTHPPHPSTHHNPSYSNWSGAWTGLLLSGPPAVLLQDQLIKWRRAVTSSPDMLGKPPSAPAHSLSYNCRPPVGGNWRRAMAIPYEEAGRKSKSTVRESVVWLSSTPFQLECSQDGICYHDCEESEFVAHVSAVSANRSGNGGNVLNGPISTEQRNKVC